MGYSVPENIITNHDLSKIMDTSDDWIQSRSGIKERRWATDNVTTSDLAYKACKQTIENSKINPIDIDMIIVGTLSSDYFFPGVSAQLQEKLNLKMYFRYKKCFDCVVKEETKIRAQGKDAWTEYSRKKMLANAQSWMRDTDKEIEELKKVVTETYWQNADGKSEEIDISAFIEKITKDYENIKNEILQKKEGSLTIFFKFKLWK